MFTGIIESMASVINIEEREGNRTFIMKSPAAGDFYVNQSVSHNGVCLTVESTEKPDLYGVTAIEETLKKTMLGQLKMNSRVNLERSLTPSTRMDGHFVQGHVDVCGRVLKIRNLGGSFEYLISYPRAHEDLIVPRGSICINGISLTVADSLTPEGDLAFFPVAIIPHTSENTNIRDWKEGDSVNLEFDVLGKYVIQFLSRRV